MPYKSVVITAPKFILKQINEMTRLGKELMQFIINIIYIKLTEYLQKLKFRIWCSFEFLNRSRNLPATITYLGLLITRSPIELENTK